MEQEFIIAVSIVATIAAVLVIHKLLHNLVKFKMDESTILRSFEGSHGDYQFRSANVISSATGISTERVATVCSKSKAIKRDSKGKESWCLK